MVTSPPFMKLKGINALITGGSQGLGKVIAEHFLREGANVLICARNRNDLKATASELSEKFPKSKLLFNHCDVSSEESVEGLFKYAVANLWPLHALVLNAGIYGPMGPTESVDLAEWRRAIDINLFGVLLDRKSVV